MKMSLGIMILSLFLLTSSGDKEYYSLKGKVIDKDNNPVIGATVRVLGTNRGTYVKNKDGSFEINKVRIDADSINVSYIGFKSVTLKVKKDEVNIIRMEDAPVKTEEIMVISDKASLSDAIGSTSAGVEASGRGFVARAAVASGDLSGTYPSRFESDKPVSISVSSNGGAAGKLTAGEINDFTKWNLWNDLSTDEFSNYSKSWKFYPQKRYSVAVKNQNGNPVFGAKVKLMNNNAVIWEAVSDNTGKAELWSDAFQKSDYENKLSAEIHYLGKVYFIKNLNEFHNGINVIEIDAECKIPKSADVVFVVDATGSMGDEINYLKADLEDIIFKIQDTIPEININLGSVFYRDKGDQYVTKSSDLNSDMTQTIKFIKENTAGGGGDTPEAVHSGLEVAINQLSWSENSIAKVIFLILDAPPHQNAEVIQNIQELTRQSAQKGIRIIPVTCSGIDKETEFLMRAMALLTNGTYTFLTDDSGIGNPHIKPSTDKYEVEIFNDLVKRLIIQYVSVPNCISKSDLVAADTTLIKNEAGSSPDDTLAKTEVYNFKCYPNPTSGIINIISETPFSEIFIADISGKIMKRIESKDTSIVVDISEFPNGIYFVMYQYKPDKWARGKIILSK